MGERGDGGTWRRGDGGTKGRRDRGTEGRKEEEKFGREFSLSLCPPVHSSPRLPVSPSPRPSISGEGNAAKGTNCNAPWGAMSRRLPVNFVATGPSKIRLNSLASIRNLLSAWAISSRRFGPVT